jgi:hypothetical protein
MKVTLDNGREFEVKTLYAEVFVRSWADAIINGRKDVNGELIPCRKDDCWCPEIDLETGTIINWTQGKRAEIYFKVCDEGSYYLKDSDGNIVVASEDNYVPDMMCPNEKGYGDYIIMTIDNNGIIQNWKFDMIGFEAEEFDPNRSLDNDEDENEEY